MVQKVVALRISATVEHFFSNNKDTPLILAKAYDIKIQDRAHNKKIAKS